MSPRFKIIENARCRAFRELVKQRRAQVIDVPAGEFKESGTGIATVIVLFNCARVKL
jgi:hypothetical protein